MKYRNIQVAKRTGVKILAGLLVFGLTFSAPATAWAAESGLTEVTSNGSENGEKLQAKSIDGRDTLTEVSDLVLEMTHNEEIRYNEETGYLEDTGLRDAAKTGWKVDPITGDEVEVIPANPDVPFLADAEQKISAFTKADLIKSAFDHGKIFHQISFVVCAFYMAQLAFAGQLHFRALLI